VTYEALASLLECKNVKDALLNPYILEKQFRYLLNIH